MPPSTRAFPKRGAKPKYNRFDVVPRGRNVAARATRGVPNERTRFRNLHHDLILTAGLAAARRLQMLRRPFAT
ncbi:hypothetical protein BHM03_00044872 [Ensete ventricosum]|nr:hypothetical protein BHM03_00044872 [Ensete ventricosum]